MFRRMLSAIVWRVLSTPIFPKIMGIGFLTAILFGGVTLLQMRAGTSRILYQVLEQKILTTTETLADMIDTPASTGDTISILQQLDQARRIYPEIRYVIVRDSSGQVLTSTFKEVCGRR